MDLFRYAWERTIARTVRRERRLRPDDRLLGRAAAWSRKPDLARLTVCIPMRDRLDLLLPCLASLAETSIGSAVDLVVGDTGSNQRTVGQLNDLGINVVQIGGPFNFSRACNEMARASHSERLLFLNNDTLAISSNWVQCLLDEPVDHVVGAALVYPGTRRLQHAGVKVVEDRGWLRPNTYRPVSRLRDGSGLALENVGLGKRLESVAERASVMAVTGAFLSTSRERFEALEGFDERFQADLQDIDYCLRARHHGADVVCRRDIVFAHRHAASRGRYEFPIEDWRLFIDRWRHELERWHDAGTLQEPDDRRRGRRSTRRPSTF